MAIYTRFDFSSKTIDKQDKEIRRLMMENVWLQFTIFENDNMMKIVPKLEDEIRECKQHSLETNDHIYKIELKKAMEGKNGHGDRGTLPYVEVKRKCRY